MRKKEKVSIHKFTNREILQRYLANLTRFEEDPDLWPQIDEWILEGNSQKKCAELMGAPTTTFKMYFNRKHGKNFTTYRYELFKKHDIHGKRYMREENVVNTER